MPQLQSNRVSGPFGSITLAALPHGLVVGVTGLNRDVMGFARPEYATVRIPRSTALALAAMLASAADDGADPRQTALVLDDDEAMLRETSACATSFGRVA